MEKKKPTRITASHQNDFKPDFQFKNSPNSQGCQDADPGGPCIGNHRGKKKQQDEQHHQKTGIDILPLNKQEQGHQYRQHKSQGGTIGGMVLVEGIWPHCVPSPGYSGHIGHG